MAGLIILPQEYSIHPKPCHALVRVFFMLYSILMGGLIRHTGSVFD
jgi:hypothetical protein